MVTQISYSHEYLQNDDVESVLEVLRSEWLIQGSKVGEFEDRLREYAGAKYAVALANATVALHLSMLAPDTGKGDEVVRSALYNHLRKNGIFAQPNYIPVHFFSRTTERNSGSKKGICRWRNGITENVSSCRCM